MSSKILALIIYFFSIFPASKIQKIKLEELEIKLKQTTQDKESLFKEIAENVSIIQELQGLLEKVIDSPYYF